MNLTCSEKFKELRNNTPLREVKILSNPSSSFVKLPSRLLIA